MKTITEHANELYEADPEKEAFSGVVRTRSILKALDEYQATVEARLSAIENEDDATDAAFQQARERIRRGARVTGHRFKLDEPDRISPLAVAMIRDGARLIDRAIISWAETAGMSPAEWLRRWRPVLRQEMSADISLRLVVEAKPIESFESDSWPPTPRTCGYEADPVDSEE